MTEKRGVSRTQQARVFDPVATPMPTVAPPPPSGVADPPIRPITGGRAARTRGAILRRLLALADTVALLAGLAVAYLAVVGAAASSLLWVLAFAPVWILVIKLHGLYDRDHRRIRHSTLDE